MVAICRGGGIGKDGTLPWHFPEDLKHFKQTTTGHTIIMGRKTHESIGRPLPNRRNIVLSRRPGYEATGCEIAPDVPTAVRMAREGGDELPFIIGGASSFAEALEYASHLYLTEIDADYECDTFFPDFDRSRWSVVETRAGEDPRITYLTLVRR